MDTRREFLKKASLLSGMTGMHAFLPESIRKALAIEPAPGSSWEDAEHIVILMQENRSFDHAFGTLRGVRGFNDPRAIQLPNGNPVWLQSNKAGQTFAPFRLNIKDTKATWMSSLPHSWANQVGARNDGRYDQWLNEKRNGIKEYADMPLTMGYYDRQDIPFYYQLADAFTVCDQHFCSSLTGTTPNRLFFWSGSIRAEQNENSRAHVWNEDADYESLHWKTFPELLEDQNVSWKAYQNEISLDVGFEGEQADWLSNFGDNPLEFFAQYNVKLYGKYLIQMRHLVSTLPGEINALKLKKENLPAENTERVQIQKEIDGKEKALDEALLALKNYNEDKFNSLSQKEKNLHQNAFTTNVKDPDYHSLEEIIYDDHGEQRKLKIPKGDVLHQFRDDVKNGQLPTVSWLTAPASLSDHPSYAWFGAWYVSEVMDILTQNPDVWKKTIFILTYDENDGYFDHVPPFVAPHSEKPQTGKASDGMDTRVEFVTTQQEKERNGFPVEYEGESPVGLGYRVPLIVASPWSRGGYVNSEVFDHTSTLQFLEEFIAVKKGKSIQIPNISEWRRTVCGDLTSIFRPSTDNLSAGMEFIPREPFMESVYNAKFKKLPSGYQALTATEVERFRADPYSTEYMAQQEKGIKPSNALSYQLYADGKLNAEKNVFEIHFTAGNKFFGKKSLGSPFNVYAPGKYLQSEKGKMIFKDLRAWAFAVRPADTVQGHWSLNEFENGKYSLRVYGPNGFFREFKGSVMDTLLDIRCEYQLKISGKPNGNLDLKIRNDSGNPVSVEIVDNVYKKSSIKKTLPPKIGNVTIVPLDLAKQFGWYDFTVSVNGDKIFERRFAGRVETGDDSYSDPYMGRMI